MLRSLLLLAAMAVPFTALSQEKLFSGPLPYPEVKPDETWVFIEIWPDVPDITLSAYFMDWPPGKNANLCEALKDAVDRDQEATSKVKGREFTSYRQCLTLADAVAKGYVRPGP